MPISWDEKPVRFCGELCIDELTTLNCTALRDTKFSVELGKLQERNLSWVRRNPKVFMMIMDPLFGRGAIGYSAMLPLTTKGIDIYLDGALKDPDIPAYLVAPEENSTAAVLLFAIYLRQDYSFVIAKSPREYTPFFLKQILFHVKAMHPDDRKYPPLLSKVSCPPLSGGCGSRASKALDGSLLMAWSSWFSNALLKVNCCRD